MRSSIFFLCLTLTGAAVSAQNEILYYKFDAAGGKRVINYAQGTSAPHEGTLVSQSTSPWAPGRWGTSLRGVFNSSRSAPNAVDTGWKGGLTGSFTIAWQLENRFANSPQPASWLFGGKGHLWGLAGDKAKSGILVGGYGGPDLSVDVELCVLTGWNHFALVVDASKKTATWYWNGKQLSSVAIAGGAKLAPSNDPFWIARHTDATIGNLYDLDEFRLLARAASPAEILAWATTPTAADAPFGSGCGAKLTTSGGRPTLGNTSYALEVQGVPSAPVALALGSNRLRLGPLPLPFDLGAVFANANGCLWQTSSDLFVAVTLDANGEGTLPLRLPNDARLAAAVVYSQAMCLENANVGVSNAVAHSLGR